MVPHVRILAAIALVARCSGDEAHVRDEFCRHLRVRFPADLFGQKAFWITEVVEKLPVEVRVAVETAQMGVTGDYTPMFDAAVALGVDKFVFLGGSDLTSIGAYGPAVIVPDELVVWRQHDAIRMALECMFLCDIPVATIAEDMRRMYGRPFEENYLTAFRDLFCDRARLGDWSAYSRCLSQDELAFKHRLTREPTEFVRWKLGVPVHLDNETVLDRLMSEAYFTERVLKHEARGSDPHGLPALGQNDLARVKLERDTIFKCLDRKLKMKEMAGQTTSTASSLHQQMAEIKLRYAPQSQEQPLISELNDG